MITFNRVFDQNEGLTNTQLESLAGYLATGRKRTASYFKALLLAYNGEFNGLLNRLVWDGIEWDYQVGTSRTVEMHRVRKVFENGCQD